jgi:hypothetical protein
MRSTAIFAFFSLLLAGEAIAHDHGVMGKRHAHHRLFKKAAEEQGQVIKRGTCEFPKDAGLVAVTPDALNAGWAMSPDQPCRPYVYNLNDFSVMHFANRIIVETTAPTLVLRKYF